MGNSLQRRLLLKSGLSALGVASLSLPSDWKNFFFRQAKKDSFLFKGYGALQPFDYLPVEYSISYQFAQHMKRQGLVPRNYWEQAYLYWQQDSLANDFISGQIDVAVGPTNLKKDLGSYAHEFPLGIRFSQFMQILPKGETSHGQAKVSLPFGQFNLDQLKYANKLIASNEYGKSTPLLAPLPPLFVRKLLNQEALKGRKILCGPLRTPVDISLFVHQHALESLSPLQKNSFSSMVAALQKHVAEVMPGQDEVMTNELIRHVGVEIFRV